jgi:hypothetical protein
MPDAESQPIAITGADPSDPGPRGCVARFTRAGADRDQAAALAELHPDHREGLTPTVESPPGVTAIAIGEATACDEGSQVEVMLTGPEGAQQRFVFLVRPHGDAWGIDLPGSLQATFGMDPMQMMEDGLRSAVQPLGEAMQAIGQGLGEALGGIEGGGDASSAPAVRRILLDETVDTPALIAPATITAEALELHYNRQAVRDPDTESLERSADLSLKVRFTLPEAWIAQATLGVTLATATTCDGDDVMPTEAGDDLGAERYAEWERERRDWYARIPLRAPDGACSGLAEVSGRVRLAVTGGELVELLIGPVGDLLGKPLTLAACGVEIALRRDDDGNLVLDAPSAWIDRMDAISPVDAAGDTLNDSTSSWGDGETTQRTWQSEIPPDASLRVRFWTMSGTVEAPFTVAGLPLTLA